MLRGVDAPGHVSLPCAVILKYRVCLVRWKPLKCCWNTVPMSMLQRVLEKRL